MRSLIQAVRNWFRRTRIGGYQAGYRSGLRHGADTGYTAGYRAGTLAGRAAIDATAAQAVKDAVSAAVAKTEERLLREAEYNYGLRPTERRQLDTAPPLVSLLRTPIPGVYVSTYTGLRGGPPVRRGDFRVTVRVLLSNGTRYVRSWHGRCESDNYLPMRRVMLAAMYTLRRQLAAGDASDALTSTLRTGLQNLSPTDTEAVVQLCRAYIQAAAQQDPLELRGQLAGEDPAVRFPHVAADVFDRPWSWLFSEANQPLTVPIRQGLWGCGFGDPALGRPAKADRVVERTVRDLLLVSADDLSAVLGCGPTSVRAIRRVMTFQGLALWGDTYRQPPDGRRHNRSIQF
jgi:hypothetical protein